RARARPAGDRPERRPRGAARPHRGGARPTALDRAGPRAERGADDDRGLRRRRAAAADGALPEADGGARCGDREGGSMSAPLKLVVVSAGASDPSSTQMLADRLAARTVAGARERGVEMTVSTIELRTLANEIAAGLVSQVNGPGLKAAIEKLAEADGIVAPTPISK